MADEAGERKAPTRRDYVMYSGAVIGGGLFAGCSGRSDSDSSPTSTTESATDTETETPENTSYTVRMAPVGEVSFESVPETVYGYSPHYADMAVAYGHGDAIASLGSKGYVASMTYYYDAIESASFDGERIRPVWNDGIDKELFYEIDADVHLQDPCWLTSFAENWDDADIEEIRENIGPWVGNRYSREHTRPPEGCREGYRYYSLWELSGKIATVFREQERFRALQDVYESLYGSIRAKLPAKNERPTVGLLVFRDGGFRPYEVNGPGFAKAHVRPLGARDAFADSDQTYDENYEGELDYEAMLEIDPDVVLHNFGVGGFFDVAAIRETLEDHPVGSELTAVQENRVYASGIPFQGPLMNLFQLEMTAKQLYPDVFGEWPGDGSESSYPSIPEDERLFDRERVANIVGGNI
jgi:ABC-type Fe3+-hydroxamate transport system substrate-binding protein